MQEVIVERFNGDEDLFIPNYNQNIFMTIPTAFRMLGIDVMDRKNLFDNKNCKSMLEENECLSAENVINVIVDSVGIQQFPLASKLFKIY